MAVEKYEISESSFKLVQKDTRLADKPLETKPTTFLKDAVKRFAKNKSSIVAAVILGIIILLAIFLPVFSRKNIKYVSVDERFLAPKLFEPGTVGFWDGTKKYKDVVYDPINQAPAGFYKPAVTNLKVLGEGYIDVVSEFGAGGYVVFFNDKTNNTEGEISYLYSYPTTFTSDGNYKANIKLYDNERYKDNRQGEFRVSVRYETTEVIDNQITKVANFIPLTDYMTEYGEFEVNISEALAKKGIDKLTNGTLCFELLPNEEKGIKSYIMIESVVFSANEDVENYEELVNSISFTDANKMVLLKLDEATKEAPVGYWNAIGSKNVHNVRVTKCNFTYDTYAKPYGEKEYSFALSDLDVLKREGYIDYDEYNFRATFKVLKDCYIIDIVEDDPATEADDAILFNPKIPTKPTTIKLRVMGYGLYKHGGDESVYSKAPKFLLGTDDNGFDLITKSFKGLRTSLLLGVATAAFCFVFGLIWGSISGYFGGTVDLLMERFMEILGGVPWIVVMTLAILHFGNNMFTFVLALCMTGWMGTASRTRTQFYRFKGREYVLASRTLGSSDFRLIFKHILPNSMGTIITSSVLMVPSVIFSESTLAFLNLGLQGVDAFGVMMSNNQMYLQSYPHLVVFPAVIISLLMISFNLFGNGLRDAFNPSLKGSE